MAADEQQGKATANRESDEKMRDELINRARETRGREEDKGDEPTFYSPPSPGDRRTDSTTGDRTPDGLLGWLRRGGHANIHLMPPNLNDMSMFCRQLSTLLDVGIPLLQSLKILAQRTTHPRLRRVLARVAQRVEEGNQLSAAMREHPGIFPQYFVSVVEVGELGGILEGSMRRLAEVMEMKTAMNRRIRAALAYPTAALLVCITIVFIMMYYAVPKFASFYAQLGNAELPRITQQVIAISDFIRDWWMFYIPGVFLILLLLWLWGKARPGKYMYHWLALNFPRTGVVATKINVARFTRSIGSLVAAGIPLLEALRVTARTSENVIISNKLMQVHDTLERGGRLADPLRQDYTIPPMVVDMMEIGYEAGAMDDMLLKIADNYDDDVRTTLDQLSAIIEPILIVVLGLAVVYIGAAMLLPYFTLAKVI